jgi:signal transduction histidine kinase/ActR/RegA family two-component response regulator
MKSEIKRIGRLLRYNEFFPIDLTTGATLLLGTIMLFGVTIFAWNLTTATTYERNLAAFETLSKDSELALTHKIESYRQSLDSGAALFAASDMVTKSEWKVFVDTLKIEDTLPGINGIGYIEQVLRSGESEYLDTLASAGVTGFSVHPRTQWSEILPIVFIEPMSLNKGAVGRDIGFEANRRAAAHLARDTGKATITKRIFLTQDQKKSAGFLLLRPIYKLGHSLDSVSQRRAAFRGWIYAPFIASRFMQGLTASQGTKFVISVHNGNSTSESELIFENEPGSGKPRSAQYSVTKVLPIMGQQWTVSWYSTSEFESIVGTQEPKFVLIGGLSLVLAFATLVMFSARREAYVKQEVKNKTQILVDKEREIVSALEVAEAATGAKSKFLANMSHEIRTPMNGVIGFTQLLDDGTLNDTQKKYVRLISDSGSAMMTLLNDILDISKVDSGSMTIAPEPFDVRHLLNSCVKIFSPNAEEKNLTIMVEVDKNLPQWVQVDGFRLRQIVMNLLANAIKFTEAGYITISAKFTAMGQSGGADNCHSELAISVADTGAGISPDRQHAIFEPFMQEDDSTARKHGGSGLGLTICKQLIELMGGSIQLDSHVGRGSKFTVKIPVSRLEQGTSEKVIKFPTHTEAQCKNGVGGIRILVAEDQDVNQVLIGEMLTRLGYDYELAVDGAEAVAMIRKAEFAENQYDLALMDLQMPYVDGIKATRMVREQGIDAKRLPIIALTANAFEQDVERCMEAGMQAHLAKPLAIEDLRKAVLDWLA